jgi:very-short-patch-repair endonuclease
MARESSVAKLSALSAPSLGVFRGRDAVEAGVRRKQLTALIASGVIVRGLPDTYRMTAVAPSREQRLRAALLWAGTEAAAAGRSAGELYRLEGVRADVPEIVVPRKDRVRSADVIVHRPADAASSMVRRHQGLRVTGIEPTLVALAAALEDEAFEVACEDARRRRLTSVPALRAYVERHGRPGRSGVGALRRLLAELDPTHPSRSTLEVKTRRLLVANGITHFSREFPLEWNGRTYLFDFCFDRLHTILETNGRRWHDDPADYEDDNEKWSVPGRHGYRIVFATWSKVTKHPERLLQELATTLSTGSKFVRVKRS